MSKEKINNLVIENARILFRNFRGEETKYNRAGNRNFCVVIEDEKMANSLLDDGWNVRITKPHPDDPDYTPIHYLPVAVSFDNRPPKVYLITKCKDKVKSKNELDEDSIASLDYADIVSVDLNINPYQWEVNNKSGVKAYLRTGYFVIEEDEFAMKYSSEDLEDELPF
jgi:hypothetical protein